MNQKGFSLIELTVSTAIIAIVSVIVFTGYRSMGRVNFLEDEANAVLTGIEDARATALSAIEMRREEDGEQVDYFTITLNEDHFILFEGTEEDEDVYEFEGGVEITEGAGRVIGFRPPEPEVLFLDDFDEEVDDDGNDSYEDSKCLEFTINYAEDEEEDVIVRINRAGLVYITQDEDEKDCD